MSNDLPPPLGTSSALPGPADIANAQAPDGTRPGAGDGMPATFTARLRGEFRLVHPNGTVVTPSGRKARALLAHLLLVGGDAVSRPRLTGVLWSRRGDDQARASLRQTLYEMRELSCGLQPLLVVDRHRVGIAAPRVVTDLDRLHGAATAADGSYRGLLGEIGSDELLSDLDGVDPSFDEWLAVQRVRHADLRRDVVFTAATRALDANDATAARELAEHLLACDPTDEAAARIAMEACARLDDRGGVRRIFARLASSLRDDLGIAPADQTAAVHWRCGDSRLSTPSAGATDAAPVAPDAATTSRWPDSRPPRPPADASCLARREEITRLARRGPSSLTVSICAIVLVGILAGAVLHGAAQATGKRMLVVGPLRVSETDAVARSLGIGMPSALSRAVYARRDALDVVDARQLPAPDGHARYLLDIEAQSDGLRVRTDVQLREEGSATILWSRALSAHREQVDDLRETIAATVADVATCALGDADSRELAAEALRAQFARCDRAGGPLSGH